ncbi:MAG: histidinol-phosphate transaminase [Myxococcales bacterium]|nr:histidinol-phosphate transaminase [Myxococcales bacterium]
MSSSVSQGTSPKDLVRENIRNLRPYQPGKPIEEVEREIGITGAIKLASNENPLGPSPLALEAAAKMVAQSHLYPDGAAYYLRRDLAELHGIAPEQLVFGSGCNEVIQMLIGAFCVPGKHEVLSHKYAFISYRLQTLAHGCKFVEAEVTKELGCDVDALLAKVTENTRLIFVANPNNPTGAHLDKSQLEKLLAGVPPHAIVVIDEAYHEYARVADADYPKSHDYASDRPLLVTLRTFSKIYGLAGMRVGYGICSIEVADFLNRLRRPFNVNLTGQEAARASIRDVTHVQRSAELARDGIAKYRDAAAELGIVAYPSLGNFLLIDVKRPADEVYEALLRMGVIVRPMAVWGLTTHLRISIGTDEQNERCLNALRTVLK